MAELILPPGYVLIQLQFKHALVARPMLTTFAAEIDTPPFSQGNCNAVISALRAAVAPLYDSEWTIAPGRVTAGGDPPTAFVTPGTITGSASAAESPPPQVALLISKRTGFVGRRFRGRCYLPCGNEQSINQDGSVSGTYLTTLNNAAIAITAALDDVASNLAGQVLLHSDIGVDPTPVTSFVGGTYVATQRRRLKRPSF